MQRRDFLKSGMAGAAALAVGTPLLAGCTPTRVDFGALFASGVPNLLIPAGFTARKVATTGQVVSGSSYTWHVDPDGGAVFPTVAGGWVYVSNSEVGSGGGGVGAIEFDSSANIVDAYSICSGTDNNCAGGASPWNTWITCEEVEGGRAVECDPFGVVGQVNRLAMGRFYREAVAFHPGDPNGDNIPRVYQTEDRSDGGLYRFTPDVWGPGGLASGLLEVLVNNSGTLAWEEVPDPDGSPTVCRDQVPAMVVFNGGEGIWYTDNILYFTTKGDGKVWALADGAGGPALSTVYDNAAPFPGPWHLTGVDNVLAASVNRVFVAEDGGNMEVVGVDVHTGATYPVLRYTISGSEIAGPAFDPSGTRLYFSSQGNPGETFEITGPWNED